MQPAVGSKIQSYASFCSMYLNHVGHGAHPGRRGQLCAFSRSNSSSLSESSDEEVDKSSRRLSSGWKGMLGEKTSGVLSVLNTDVHDG